MITAQQVTDVARTWVGTPFKHQGRLKGKAVDCGGLIVGIANDLGIEVKDFLGYGREPANGMLERIVSSQTVKERKIKPGCILLMRFVREPQHLAIVTTNNTIIHAYANIGKVTEHRLSNMWKARVTDIYRFKELE